MSVTAITPPDGRAPALVSVVVVAYNAGADLDTCLDSLLRQTYPRVELLVVDNVSTDGSTARLEERYPEITVIRASTNLGYAGGNNLGFAFAHGDYVAVLNPDTEAAPDWLAALVGALEGDPLAGLATSKILLFDRRDRINTCGNDIHLTGLTFCRGLGQPSTAFAQPEIVSAVSGAAFLIRRSLVEYLGGFAETFFTYLEDTDLSWRAALAGFHCVYVPGSLVYHRYTTRVSTAKAFYLERNRYLMLLQNCRLPTLLLLLPALLLAECLTWGYMLLRGHGHVAAKGRAYLWVLGHGRELVAARRRVQCLRRVRDRVIVRRLDWHLALEHVSSGSLLTVVRAVVTPAFRAYHRILVAIVVW